MLLTAPKGFFRSKAEGVFVQSVKDENALDLGEEILRFRRGIRNVGTIRERLKRVAQASNVLRDNLLELACGRLEDAASWPRAPSDIALALTKADEHSIVSKVARLADAPYAELRKCATAIDDAIYERDRLIDIYVEKRKDLDKLSAALDRDTRPDADDRALQIAFAGTEYVKSAENTFQASTRLKKSLDAFEVALDAEESNTVLSISAARVAHAEKAISELKPCVKKKLKGTAEGKKKKRGLLMAGRVLPQTELLKETVRQLTTYDDDYSEPISVRAQGAGFDLQEQQRRQPQAFVVPPQDDDKDHEEEEEEEDLDGKEASKKDDRKKKKNAMVPPSAAPLPALEPVPEDAPTSRKPNKASPALANLFAARSGAAPIAEDPTADEPPEEKEDIADALDEVRQVLGEMSPNAARELFVKALSQRQGSFAEEAEEEEEEPPAAVVEEPPQDDETLKNDLEALRVALMGGLPEAEVDAIFRRELAGADNDDQNLPLTDDAISEENEENDEELADRHRSWVHSNDRGEAQEESKM